MKTLLQASAAFVAMLFVSTLALAEHKAKAEMEAMMTRYVQLWNAYDAVAIVKDIYRLEPSHPWSTETGLKAEFDRLKSQGYSKSEMSSITGCALSSDTGRVELRYTRWKTDGSFMPPKDRASVYELKRFPDGWRATAIRGLPTAAKMECPLAAT